MTVRKTIELSEDDAVREALALLAHDEKVRALRAAIAKGEASGFEEEPFDFYAFLSDLHGSK